MSFFAVIGTIVDHFRRGAIVTPYVLLADIAWRKIPRSVVKSIDDLLSNIFGKNIWSLESALLVVFFSVIINLMIYRITFWSTDEIYTVGFLSTTKALRWPDLLPSFAGGAMHDVLSFGITRILIRRFIETGGVLNIVVDFAIALVLFASAVSIQAQLILFGTHPHYFSQFDLLQALVRWLELVLDFFNSYASIIELFGENISSNRTHYHIIAVISAISTLLVTWLYVVGSLIAIILKIFGRAGVRVLEFTSRGGPYRYTFVFSLLSIAFVVGGLIWDHTKS